MMILAVNWVNAGLIALISFAMVFLVLVLLIGVIKIFGIAFNEKKSQTQSDIAMPAVAADGITDEEVAAIAMALHLFYNRHDEESDVLTFRHDSEYTPWQIKAISKQLK